MQVTGLSSSFAAYAPVIPARVGIHLSDFTATLNSLLFPSLNSPLAIALSGGADSMALALLADDFVRTRGGHIVTLTVDHGLRPESRAEAEQVAAWMAARGIAHHILTPPHLDHHKNMQESARTRRYDALADWCRAHDVLHCLLAHHAGDQAETVALMRARGDTADGASGMSALRNYRGVRFLRPLLGFEKEDLKKYLHAHAMTWVEDPSNQNPKFARVRMRGNLSANATERAALLTTARVEGEARTARDNALAEAAARLVVFHPTGRAELPIDSWRALPPALASQLIADLLTTIGGHTHRPRAHETVRLCAALHQAPSLRRTLHRCLLTVKGGVLSITREPAHAHECFAPAKPLAAAPFWWLNDRDT
jgi:tRNA(Ile)-lysidine synthase